MNRTGTVVLGVTALVAIGVGIERIIYRLSPPAGRQVPDTGGRFNALADAAFGRL
jgi:hypothetical protein